MHHSEAPADTPQRVRIFAGAHTHWHSACAHRRSVRSAAAQATPAPRTWNVCASVAQPVARWQRAVVTRAQCVERAYRSSAAFALAAPVAAVRTASAGFEQAQPVPRALWAAQALAEPVRTTGGIHTMQQGQPLVLALAGAASVARVLLPIGVVDRIAQSQPCVQAIGVVWQRARKPSVRPCPHSADPIEPPIDPLVPPDPLPTTGLLIIPNLKAYIVHNRITLERSDSGAHIELLAFAASLDYQSHTWTWSATTVPEFEAHLQPAADGAPAEFTARINDHPIALRLLAVRRERRFGSVRLHLSGAGKNAVLAAPAAPQMLFTNVRAMTARQMAQEALSVNGVSLGWTLRWHIDDWFIPQPHIWQHQGSYLSAVCDIAAAVGGYVQPANTAAALRVLPLYPHAPWHWAERLRPQLDVPAAACEWEGVQRRERARYNRAWVGGTSAGVFGPATRAGTSGERDAPQVLHPLITHAAAHRARALAVLSDTGPQDWVTLSLPIYRRSLATPQDGGDSDGDSEATLAPMDIDAGIIARPGTVVRYRPASDSAPMLGIVRECSIEFSAPKLRQRIVLETHPSV